MLEIKNISVDVQGKRIIDCVSLEFELGKNYCLLGKNGSGKSSLALTVMGHPEYEIVRGDIFFEGENIKGWGPDVRAQHGIFLAFQKIPEIKGVKLFEFLRLMYNKRRKKNESFVSFKRLVGPFLDELEIDKDFLRREVNVGFSGGERRKIEVLQIKLLQPKYIFLDEIDSGLDVDSLKSVSKSLSALDSQNNSFIIITHTFNILEYFSIDTVFVLQNGILKQKGDANLVQKIKDVGFQ